jgi:hypothetical protein
MLDVQSYKGVNVDSDHFLIIDKQNPRTKKTNNKRRQQGNLIGYDVANLRDIAVKKEYQDKIQTMATAPHLKQL